MEASYVEQLWARDQTAISAIEEKYGHYLHAIAYNIMGNHQDAAECVNDALLAMWNAIPPERPAKLLAFLGRITRNLALDRLRAAQAQKRGGGEQNVIWDELGIFLSAPDDTHEALMALECKRAIDAFLYRLPVFTRNVFMLRYWFFLPIAQIAANLQCTESRVAKQLSRTRSALRSYLKKEDLL